MKALLKDSGFRGIEIGPATAGYRNLITASKA